MKVGDQKRPRFGSLPMMKSVTPGKARATSAVYAANFCTPPGTPVTSVLWPGAIDSSTRTPRATAGAIARRSASSCCTVVGSEGS